MSDKIGFIVKPTQSLQKQIDELNEKIRLKKETKSEIESGTPIYHLDEDRKSGAV